ncbi:hypothetical protein QE386_000946 [Pseudoxanthomonas winnipegensis]|nr:hypothetical protein [Pseudoxanthomonas winnipegensis]
MVLAAAGQAQVVQRFGIDREDAAGRAVLGRHVADRGAIGQRQVLQAFAVELDELAHHAQLAQHLGDGQHQVGRGGALGQLAGQLEAHHLRDQHRGRLAQHRGLGLDATHAPAQHADAVDHRGVRVGAEHRVRIGVADPVLVGGHDHARQVLQVDLVDDAGIGRHHLEVVEGFLAPAQEAVALGIALEFDLAVEVQRIGLAEHVHLHRMVDHQFGRDLRVDLLGLAAQLDHRIAHGGQVDHAGHAGEVLQHHARGHEGDLGVRLGLGVPLGHRLDVLGRDADPVLAAQQVLQQDLHGVGQAGDVEALAELGKAEVGIGGSRHVQRAAGLEGVTHARAPVRGDLRHDLVAGAGCSMTASLFSIGLPA